MNVVTKKIASDSLPVRKNDLLTVGGGAYREVLHGSSEFLRRVDRSIDPQCIWVWGIARGDGNPGESVPVYSTQFSFKFDDPENVK